MIVYLMDWLIDWYEQVTRCSTSWSLRAPCTLALRYWLIDWLIDWFIGSLVYWLIFWWWIAWLINDWLIGVSRWWGAPPPDPPKPRVPRLPALRSRLPGAAKTKSTRQLSFIYHLLRNMKIFPDFVIGAKIILMQSWEVQKPEAENRLMRFWWFSFEQNHEVFLLIVFMITRLWYFFLFDFQFFGSSSSLPYGGRTTRNNSKKLARLSKYLFFIDFTYPHVSFTKEAAVVLWKYFLIQFSSNFFCLLPWVCRGIRICSIKVRFVIFLWKLSNI